MKLLLQHKTNVHITDSVKGQTSLMLAASLSEIECMRLLLDYSADPNYQDIFGQTPLHHGKKLCTNSSILINEQSTLEICTIMLS